MANEESLPSARGWRVTGSSVSLPEVHGSIPVPVGAGFWQKFLAFAGPGYLVAVGYMDPGNWATDLAGGARYGYTLLSVILISNIMAIVLQALAARLGIASGRDLAQACRDSYSRPATIALWVICEIAIAACDLAEVIGSAIALNLLFGLPLIWGVCLTALDVLVVLFMQHRGFRYVEALVVALIGALFINAAILMMAAAVFHTSGHQEVAEIGDAYKLLSPLLGTKAASILFAVALLCSGQNATLTGTLAGQIVMEGFINIRLRPWLRRLVTRLIAIIPAILVIILYGDRGTGPLIILSQVVLSLQLSFAVFPLVMFTSDRRKMGPFASPFWLQAIAWPVAIV